MWVTQILKSVFISKKIIWLFIDKMNNSGGIIMIVLAFSWIELCSHNYVDQPNLINFNDWYDLKKLT